MKITFVCTGNTCRSVLAEGFMKAKSAVNEDFNISSCGTGASLVFKVPPVVLKLLEKEGVDLSKHISTQITKDIVKNSDYIFVMEKTHLNYIVKQFPDANGKTYLLKEFAGLNGGGEIPDPIGLPDGVYRERADEIKECVNRIYEKFSKRN